MYNNNNDNNNSDDELKNEWAIYVWASFLASICALFLKFGEVMGVLCV